VGHSPRILGRNSVSSVGGGCRGRRRRRRTGLPVRRGT
jgi:hypothetical protein